MTLSLQVKMNQSDRIYIYTVHIFRYIYTHPFLRKIFLYFRPKIQGVDEIHKLGT